MSDKKPQAKVPISLPKSTRGTQPKALFEDFYLQHRNEFLSFGKKYGLNDDDILDAYQDAVIIYYEQLSAGKLNNLSSTEKTYLFGIGKHKLIDRIRDQARKEKYLSQGSAVEAEPSGLEALVLNDRQRALKASIDELGSKCRELLLLFYYQRYSIEAIRIKMNYNTDNVVKANKSRCMKSLKEITKSKDLD